MPEPRQPSLQPEPSGPGAALSPELAERIEAVFARA
jgi:hypothetical protein